MFKFLKRKKDKDQGSNPTDDKKDEVVEQPAPESPQTPAVEEDIAAPEHTEILATESIPEPEPEPKLEAEPEPEQPKKKPSLFKRLTNSLTKTRQNLTSGLSNLFLGKKTIDEDLLDEIETQLITADIGIEAAESIVEDLTQGISRKELKDPQAVLQRLKQKLFDILKPCEKPLSVETNELPYVILMIGVNGAGKTTTIGKLAKKLQNDGKKVMLAAGDTFRAAAVEQLQVWGMRNDIQVIAQHTGADSASVAFDALSAARARGIDVLIIDTAGRLHTHDNLMEELKKVKRVLSKQMPQAPHEVMLVVDAGIGQNALIQAEKFNEAIGLNSVTLTKLDGTAKGGIIFAIANKVNLPIRYIGCGEQIDDLREFKAQEFIDALFVSEDTENEPT